ncbi:glycerol-3-phosphate dehydrogenase [Halogranum rubrum]|uniref:Glycerol-3-phosphate dehydrogenase n=1 Tax=Halogranum rubrum TaxID=553466 RepID=A0A1I4J3C5_9EURY|nr:FAD-dependent oxidoreductase [Halogranum rubrum]SFL60703.1 glycerol-3-phosphate dehydrogenase [Halogranum rubrum]
MKTTVLVVGGGATGVGVARDLAMRGVDVTLVERGGLSSGTSGRSHGLLHSGARYAEADALGAQECLRENDILRDIAGEAIRDTGGLFVSLGDDDSEYFEEKLAACHEHDIPAEEISVEEARELVSDLAADVARIMHVPDGVIYPSRLVAANAASAEEHGATMFTHAPLENLHVEDGRVVAADVGGSVGDTVEAEYVVNATGAWAGECAALAGVDVAMRPNRGVMVAVDYDELGPVLNRCRDPEDGDIVIPHERQVVLGTTSVDVDDPDEYDEEQWEVEKMFEECGRMLPPVADLDVSRTYWGVRPLYGPDEDTRAGSRGISRGFFLLDHADDGVENFASIVGGKLTTYRMMAEATADHVCDELGVDATSTTAETTLPGADDPATLNRLVEKYDAHSPADEDVVASAD